MKTIYNYLAAPLVWSKNMLASACFSGYFGWHMGIYRVDQLVFRNTFICVPLLNLHPQWL